MGVPNESLRECAEVVAVDSQRDGLEANFRQIVESIPVPVAVTTPTGDVETLNGPTLEYFGKTLDDLKGWKASDVVHPDDLERTISAQLEAHEQGIPYDVESRHRRADGTYRWFNVHGLPLRDTQGNILRWFHLLVDIDDRKKAEEKVRASEHNLNKIINTIPALAWSARPDGSADFFNQHYLDYLGLSEAQAKGAGWTVAVHPDDLNGLIAMWKQIMTSEKPGETEARLRRHDGAYRSFLFRANPLRDEQGKIVKWYGANTDIEDRKGAQEALAANERDLRSIIDTIPTHIYVLDTDGSVQHVNQAVMDYTGLTLEDVQQEDYRDRVIHPEDFKRVRAGRAAALRRTEPFSTEQRVLGIDGQYRWFLVLYRPLLDDQGCILRWYVAAFDIEDRKQAEAELIRAYKSFADAQQLSKTGSFITDLIADEHNWSDEAYRIFEFEPGTKVTVDRIREVIHPEDLFAFDAVVGRGMSGGDVNFEFRIVTAHGEIKYLQGLAHVTEQVEGRPVYVGALRDVTENWAAADALRESEQQFRTIFDEAGTGITLVDLKKGEPIRNNRALQKMLGCSQDELGRFETYDRLTHPDNRKKDSATFRELCEGKRDSVNIEKHFVVNGGRSVWANVVFTLLRGDDGHPRYIIAIHEDITERKQSEETFRTIVETNPECVKIIGRDGTLHRVNAAGLAMSGAPSEEAILGQCFYDLVAPKDRDRYREFNEKVCAGHKGFLEFDLINAHGKLHHMETHAAPMLSADGAVVQLGVTRDITERKLTLERLQANQDLLDLAQKAARAMAFDWYIQESANTWSPEQEALYGLEPGTFDGTFDGWKKLVHPDDWPIVVHAIREAQETGDITAEYRTIWPDGTTHWLAAKGQMLFDEAGQPLRMVGFTSDVSRRKTAEVRLEGEKRLLEMVATGQSLIDILTALCTNVEEIAPECHCGVYLIDWDGPIVQLAVGPTLPAGYNAALEGLHFTSETGPCALAACERRQVIAENVETDEPWRSSPFRTFALAHGLASCWSTPIYSRSEEVLGTFAIYRNTPGSPTQLQQDLIGGVTHIASIAIESAKREEALRRSEAFLAESQDLARIGSFAWNVATNKITWSEQLYRMYDFKFGVPITLELVRTRVHPNDVSLYEKMKEEQVCGGKDFEWEYRLLMPDKSIKHLYAIAHASRNHQGEVEYIAAVQDVTARKASEEALQRSEAETRRANEYLTVAQELSKTGSYARDVSTDKQTLSDEMYRIWEFDPSKKVTHELVLGRIHPEDLQTFEGSWEVALEAGDDIDVSYRIVTDSGAVKHLRSVSRRVADITDRPVYVGATQDVTEKKLAEEALDQVRSELAHVSRVTSLGALTASIAHEVNQPLSGIITNASTCRRMLAADPPNVEGALETARRIIRDGDRASDVITRLRSLFGKKEFKGESINLNDVAEEVIKLSQRELQTSEVLLKQELSDDLPIVIGDRVQLQQVILNLLLNAFHAMVDVKDRTRELLIRTEQEAGDRVLLAVKDNGVGFEPQNEAKLFDPFYTTKQSGMGIGLHVSRSIIESHHGRLWATLNDGPGATFSFSIPRAV